MILNELKKLKHFRLKVFTAFQALFLVLALATSTPCVYAHNTIELTVEIASTPEELEWGLMGRRSLDPNHGMLFIYPHPTKLTFWMFNTNMDLSIAFIDDNMTIKEIYFMKAYPEKMDPRRPVRQLADLNLYSYWGSVKRFFLEHSIHSVGRYRFALEVNAGWFDRNDIQVGDKIRFDPKLKIPFSHELRLPRAPQDIK